MRWSRFWRRRGLEARWIGRGEFGIVEFVLLGAGAHSIMRELSHHQYSAIANLFLCPLLRLPFPFCLPPRPQNRRFLLRSRRRRSLLPLPPADPAPDTPLRDRSHDLPFSPWLFVPQRCERRVCQLGGQATGETHEAESRARRSWWRRLWGRGGFHERTEGDAGGDGEG